MNNSFGYIDIILLGMIAGFIILRLRNILGRKSGHEPKIYPNFTEKKFNVQNNNIKSFKKNLEVLEGEEKKEFLKGAEIAYEKILTSFAQGDNKELKSLLTSVMATNFEQAIQKRNKENIKSEFTFIGVKKSSVEKYEKIKNEVFASVKFVSEVISVKKDKEDKIVEGNPDKIKQVVDYWKFSRNILKSGPSWYLSEIISK
jgi:predicted lipid-binding transport protein (Tim44 family)